MRHATKVWRLSTLVIALATIATACGGGEATTADANGNIVIDLTEFDISPDNIVVKVGDTVTIKLTNSGDKVHEWMIGTDVDTDEGFPSGFHNNFFDDLMGLEVAPMDAAMGMTDMAMDATDTTMADATDTTMAAMEMDDEMDHGIMIMRDPGEQATATFVVTADQVGVWEMACFQEDGAHYDDGMKGTFTVEA